MLNSRYRKARVLFGLSDIVLTALGFWAAYQTRIWLHIGHLVFYIEWPTQALLLGFSMLSWLLIGLWLEVYDRLDSGAPRIILRDTFRQCFFGLISLVVFEFALRLDLSRPFLLMMAGFSWVFLCLFRLTAPSLMGVVRREFGAIRYVMIVGLSERARLFGAELERSAQYGIRLLGFLADSADAEGLPSSIRLDSDYKVFPLGDLRHLLRRQVIDEIVFAVGSERLAGLEDVFLFCDEEGVRTRVAVDFFPHVNSTVHLDQLGATPLLTFTAAPHDEIRLLVKRWMDVALASVGIVVLLPFMLLIAAAVRLTSRGPIIFRQERCGLNGRKFTFYKFRSMCDNAEDLKPGLQHLNRKSTAFKIPNDPRTTPVGRILRKFSIDEWPQLWNILRGDMSLVGPRPAVPDEVDQYKQWQRRRLRMRPGLTCLWAVSGRDQLDFETWMRMDMQYIDNWSLGLDAKILLLTIPRVLTGHGAS
jgi:exopolysaccharide biosynthesis polyprenyl glycosylphosphotransferase